MKRLCDQFFLELTILSLSTALSINFSANEKEHRRQTLATHLSPFIPFLLPKKSHPTRVSSPDTTPPQPPNKKETKKKYPDNEEIIVKIT
mmetsp:Transcript_10050/g.19876  ORF Transcript_10050/g.19876 Transcript_10050/m.19876 type:complete len:90 (+) Transcript_10050:383-652(+)